MKSKLPKPIQKFIGQNKIHKNKVGQSPADVYSFQKKHETFYLKVTENIYAETTYSARREAKVLDWLAGKLCVPELVLLETDQNNEYMITRAITAKPLSVIHDKTDHFFIELYREALKQLHAVSIEDCPFNSDRSTRLAESRFFLDHDLLDEVDLDDDLDEYERKIWEEFKNKEQLWQYLNQQNFQEDLVFSHGDITDSNVFLDRHDQIYYLDLGRAGFADRFVDIAFIERSLREDCSTQAAKQFLQNLAQDDPFKRDYFLKLDEIN